MIDEILGLDDYEREREKIRRQAIEARGRRRVTVGPTASLVFENRDTLRYQVQEMLRTDKIEDALVVEHEIAAFSELLPTPDEVSATLFIECSDAAKRRKLLADLAGIERHVHLLVGDERLSGQFDSRPREGDSGSAVEFVRFQLSPTSLAAMDSGTKIRVLIDHPSYRHEVALPQETVAALQLDLKDAARS